MTNFRTARGGLTCAMALAALAHPASSQEAVTLDTIVVESAPALTTEAQTASRLGLRVLDIPASVDVIPADTIARRGQHTLTEAITRNATGVTSVAAPSFGTAYALRGFQGNSSVMQVYDGTRLFPGRGNITFPYDSFLAEQVEVLHGPASVIHGAGAIGGTINVTPKRPFEGPIRHEAQAIAGSDGRARLAYGSGGSLGEALAYRFAIVGDRSDGWIDGADGQSLAATGALQWQAAPTLRFTLSADYGRQEPMAYVGTPLRDGEIVGGTESLDYNVGDAGNTFRDHWLQLRTEWTPHAGLALTNTIYSIDARRDFRNAETYLWDPAADIVTVDEFRRIAQRQDQIGSRTEARFAHDLFGYRNDVVLGFDINRAKSRFADYASYGARTVDPFAPDPGLFPAESPLTPRYRSTLDQQSVFAESRLALSEHLSLSGGLRYDRMEVEREDLVNPANSFEARFNAPAARLGLVYAPQAGTAVYGQLSWATDPVNLPLLDYSASMADFDMTTGRQIEVGIKQAMGRGEWSLAAFDIVKRNLLVFDPATFGTQQVGRQSSRGVEAAASFAVAEGLRISGNAAYTRARYDEFTSIDWLSFAVVDYSGNVPLLVPEVSANLWASWDVAPRWTLHGGLQFVGKAFYDFGNTTTRDSYTLVNLGLDWQTSEASVLSLRVTNLFDRAYAPYLRTDPDTERAQAILGQPRHVELQLTSRF